MVDMAYRHPGVKPEAVKEEPKTEEPVIDTNTDSTDENVSDSEWTWSLRQLYWRGTRNYLPDTLGMWVLDTKVPRN